MTHRRDLSLRALAGRHTLFLSTLVSSCLSFVLGLLLAVHLGAHDYGVYAAALALTAYVSIAADGGWLAAAARHLTRPLSQVDRRAGVTAAWLLMIGAAISCSGLTVLVALVAGRWMPEETSHLLLVVSPLAGATIAPYFYEQLLKSSGRTGLLAAVTMTSRGLSLVGVLVVVAVGGGPTAALIVTLVATLVAGALALLGEPLGLSGLRATRSAVRREHRTFGRQLYIGRTFNLLAFRADVVLLTMSFPPASVAQYVLATSMLSPVAMFGQASASTRFRAMRDAAPDTSWARRLALVAVVLALLACGVGALSVWWPLGRAYEPLLPLLPLVAVAAVLQAAYQPANSWLLANGEGPRLRRLLLVAGTVNLLANLALVPWLGGMGGALGSITGNASYLWLARRACRAGASERLSAASG
jgi:O-antigen/teichoic acid export membrane protein